MLHSEEMGREWTELVHFWEEFKNQYGFVEVGRLGSANHLWCIADWIQLAQSAVYRPTINLIQYPSDFVSWWWSLQLGWRVRSGVALVRDMDNLEALRKSWLNRLLSIMAALFFWGVALGPGGLKCLMWCSAVKDVHWVIKRLLLQSWSFCEHEKPPCLPPNLVYILLIHSHPICPWIWVTPSWRTPALPTWSCFWPASAVSIYVAYSLLISAVYPLPSLPMLLYLLFADTYNSIYIMPLSIERPAPMSGTYTSTAPLLSTSKHT